MLMLSTSIENRQAKRVKHIAAGIYVNQSINQVYFQVNMYKNEQKVQFTVIHVQGNHVHLKEQLTCKTNFTN